MAAKSSPGGFVVATVTNPGSFMATITHPTGNGYCRDRILRDRSTMAVKDETREMQNVFDTAGVVRLENKDQATLWYEKAVQYWKVSSFECYDKP